VVTIELYGVCRLRAGVGKVAVNATTLSEALDELSLACPGLDGPVIGRGLVHPAFRLSLNGERFVSDPDTPLTENDVLLLLSADVGG
jgi:hypothetical protein